MTSRKNGKSRSAAIHAKLGHPVIDADGHNIEFVPVLYEYVREIGGPKAVDAYRKVRDSQWYKTAEEERHRRQMVRTPWWGLPTRNTRDHMTAVLPALMVERMGEIGLDYSIVYPSVGLLAPHLADPDLRQVVCRALNTYQADLFRPHAAHLTPAAAIPMHTPGEAVEELEHAVNVLGLKATMMAGHVRRPIAGADGSNPHASFIDVLAMGSAYDYDRVWQKCEDLKVVPTFHSGSMGWGSRVSVDNYMFNHVGHFAVGNEAICKALFFGGVTRRFPSLKFMFLEGGVGWAVNLFADILGHWEKRGAAGIENYNPANFDARLAKDLFAKYAPPQFASKPSSVVNDLLSAISGATQQQPERLDDFAAVGMKKPQDMMDRFVSPFYFGCEADDPMNAWAFAKGHNPLNAQINAVFSSDIGHWDVTDIGEILEEVYELVEHGIFTDDDMRVFVFENAARLMTSVNPSFYAGTAVEDAVERLLAPQAKPSRRGASKALHQT